MTFRFKGVRIGVSGWVKSKATIGYGTCIGWGFCVRGSGRLDIGKFCAIGEDVRVITSNHDTGQLALNYALQSKIIGKRLVGKKRDVRIGNDVWIGDRAIILPGLAVGDGAVIGAGAVVTKSVEPYTIVGGNPARVIKKRFNKDVIDKIGSLAWWDWSFDEMREMRHLFDGNISETDIKKKEV